MNRVVQAAMCRLLRSAPVVKHFPSVRGAIHLDRDWEPGTYPRTEEERLAAAKKYDMLPEEYQPYDADKWEVSFGDYPQRPNLHCADEDSDKAWDYPFHHHNWREPWHACTPRYMWYTPELEHGEDWYISRKELFLFYACALGTTYLMILFFVRYERIVIFKPMHMVEPGAVHYHYPNSKIEMYEEHHHHH